MKNITTSEELNKTIKYLKKRGVDSFGGVGGHFHVGTKSYFVEDMNLRIEFAKELSRLMSL